MNALLIAVLAASPSADASSGGRTGHTSSGCGGCHGGSPATTTTAAFAGVPAEVAPGDTVSLRFTVGTTDGRRSQAGFNASATGGTLTAGSGSRSASGELTQSAPLAMSGGSATWTFTWTAPSTEGSVTLRGVGNAVDGNGGTSGDGWALASAVQLDVVCADDDGDGVTTCAGDCDDANADIGPGVDEVCNGIDDDCSGVVDDAPIDGDTWFTDADADGFGDAAGAVVACSQPSGTVADASDCDDTDPAANPAGVEVCGGGDQDCDGLEDDDDPSTVGAPEWYADADGDGFGDTPLTTACAAPSGAAADAGDCDDDDPSTFPGAPETCTDAIDRNCDGAVGRVDGDGDGFAACEECDDGDASRFPGAPEVCNGVDDDCDGAMDGPDAEGAVPWYADGDGDGFGDPEDRVLACVAPDGRVADASDCDDAAADTFPGADERPYDGIDQDCDGADLCDVDDDGVDATACDGEDCDDEDPTVNPAADESWYDGLDQDCDGNDDDQDGDGFGVGEDCDDADAAAFPGDGTLGADCLPVGGDGSDTPADPDAAAADADESTGCGGDKAALLLAPLALLGLRRRRRA